MGSSTEAGVWVVVFVIAIYVGLAVLVGRMAQRKGYSFAGFFCLAFFLSFIVGLVVVLVLQPNSSARMAVTLNGGQVVGPVSCPYCKEDIRPDAVVCKHCGKDVDPVVSQDQGRSVNVAVDQAAVSRVVDSAHADLVARQKLLGTVAAVLFLVTAVLVNFLHGAAQFVGIFPAGAAIILLILNSKGAKELKRLRSEAEAKLRSDAIRDQTKDS